jgi:hypothetical protein
MLEPSARMRPSRGGRNGTERETLGRRLWGRGQPRVNGPSMGLGRGEGSDGFLCRRSYPVWYVGSHLAKSVSYGAALEVA